LLLEVMRRTRIDPEARGVVCATKRAGVMGQRISGQHQGQRTLFSAPKSEDMTAPTTRAQPTDNP
jgi:hypothetical protein